MRLSKNQQEVLNAVGADWLDEHHVTMEICRRTSIGYVSARRAVLALCRRGLIHRRNLRGRSQEMRKGNGVRRCRVCGCTDNNCRKCIERTGEACYWVEVDLCSACSQPDSTAALNRKGGNK